MKCLITLTSGLSVIQEMEIAYEDILPIYGVGKPLLREDGTIYDTIAKIELVMERVGSPTLFIDLSEQVTESVIKEICELDEPLIWDATKYRYVAKDTILSNHLVCRIVEVSHDVGEIHLMVLTEEQGKDTNYRAVLSEKHMERFSNMTIMGLVDVIKANYLPFIGTIYEYVQKDTEEETRKYLKAVQELIPTAVLLTKAPFGIYCVVSDGVLKVLLKETENGQLGIEFLKEVAPR